MANCVILGSKLRSGRIKCPISNQPVYFFYFSYVPYSENFFFLILRSRTSWILKTGENGPSKHVRPVFKSLYRVSQKIDISFLIPRILEIVSWNLLDRTRLTQGIRMWYRKSKILKRIVQKQRIKIFWKKWGVQKKKDTIRSFEDN